MFDVLGNIIISLENIFSREVDWARLSQHLPRLPPIAEQIGAGSEIDEVATSPTLAKLPCQFSTWAYNGIPYHCSYSVRAEK